MFAATRLKVVEALKQRQVRQLVYFHCDHFEPWRHVRGDVSEQNSCDILDVIRMLDEVDYARKLTLFYKCHNYICTAKNRPQLRAEGDEIGFAIPSARETNIARVALEHIAHRTSHEIQVHYHHEFFTGNDKYCKNNPRTREFFESRNTPQLDRERWEIGLSLALETTRLEANIPLDRWFFVHGMWALNGSDTEVCTITDEIDRLRRLGCLGDFSFPAGRVHCDPRYLEPVFVRPVDDFKGYDAPEAEAVPAYGNAAAAQQGKFFIWSSEIKANASSIDYYAAEVRRRCEDVASWAEEIIEKSVLEDGTLFVKTHAHSMYMDYFEGARRPIPPHLYPGVQNMLCALFDGATDAGIEVDFSTVGEVYRRFVEADKNDAPEQPRVVRIADNEVTTETTGHLSGLSLGRLREVAREVNRCAVVVMRDRVATLGELAAGAYVYYGDLIKQERLLQEYEIQIAGYCIEHFEQGQPVIEVGCGLGALVLLLAATGRKAYGVDGDPRRIASFAALREAIGETLPEAKANSRVVTGFFPSDGSLALPRTAGLVITNTIYGIDLEKQRAIIAAAAEFAWVLFDAQRFFVKRTTGKEIDDLLRLFTDAGFSEPVKVLDLGDGGKYYRSARPGDAGPAS